MESNESKLINYNLLDMSKDMELKMIELENKINNEQDQNEYTELMYEIINLYHSISMIKIYFIIHFALAVVIILCIIILHIL